MKFTGSLIEKDGTRKYLNPVEREAFRNAFMECQDVEELAFCLTLFYTGCRISEALAITGNYFDLEAGIIVFHTLKRRDPDRFRILPIPSVLGRALKAVASEKSSRDLRIFDRSRPWGYRLIKRYMRAAGLDGVKASPKGLRHSFAVACVMQNIPITAVQRWLGHSSLETTAIYLQISGEEDRKLAERLW